MGSVTIGVDVGQRVDPTAIAVCERQGDRYNVRHLERLTLGTPYPAVAERIGEVYRGAVEWRAASLFEEEVEKKGSLPEWLTSPQDRDRQAARSTWLLVDATGVGTPVVDLIREQGGLAGAKLTACFFTSGDRCTVKPGAPEASVGKAYLVSRLQALIQSKRIALPRTAEARALADELLDYEIRVDEAANMTAGAFKVGAHDDLVTALGLACLVEQVIYKTGVVSYI